MYSCDETKLHNEIEQPVVCTLSQPAVTPSITYSKASSDDISVDVRPPSPSIISDDGADAEPDYIHTRPSPSGDSSTLGSRKGKGDDMTSQLFQISNSSRVSVIPGADILHHGGDLARFRSNQSDSDAVSDFIYPILLKDTLRYKRERKIDTKDVKFELKPYQKLSLGHLPSGWKQFAHPEGQPYFYHAEKRIVTENWLWDEDEMKILNKFIFEIEEFVRTRRLEQPPDTHLFLEWREDSEGQHWCGYYYACASTRSLFWLETHDISGDLDEIKGEISPTHIQLFLQYQFWQHWNYFPHINNSTPELFDLVMNTIIDARTDVQSSRETTINYSKEDLKEMAEIVEAASRRTQSHSSGWCIGRFMSMLVRDQYLNFYGQYGARVDRSKPIYDYKKHPRSWLIQLLSFLLFAAPNVHLTAIEDIWVDQLALRPRCIEFFAKLNNQWGEHIVHASILLNANVAFLAIPSIDPSNNTETVLPTRTLAQIVSYISVVTSFGSMMLALLLVRQHKTKEFDAHAKAEEFQRYFSKQKSPTRGFEALAIVYSLPYALLTWAMATFLVAFLLMCLKTSTAVTRCIVGVASLSVLLLICWCITKGWEKTEFEFRDHFQRLVGWSGGWGKSRLLSRAESESLPVTTQTSHA